LASGSAFADVTYLLVGGGGGGAGYSGSGVPGDPGQAGTSGTAGYGAGGGTAGVAGSGGGGGTGEGGNYNGGGGGGIAGNGGNGEGAPPGSGEGSAGNGGFGAPTFAAGAGGGVDGQFANGGFGGGGGGGWQGGGGGGGYSGGGGGDGVNSAGGGGGSYVNPAFTSVTITPGANGTSNGSANAGLDGYVTINGLDFDATGSIVDYTVPTSAVYDITAVGAQGGGGTGSSGGYGALVSGDIFLNAGTVLGIVVGGQGLTGNFDGIWGGGGGGGSFVFETAATAVPEPATWALMLVGFAGLGFAGYRRGKMSGALTAR
jgi:hypothetical protein